jgi:conjugative transfer pilus assembly protein TraH
MKRIVKSVMLIMLISLSFISNPALGFNLKDVFENLHTSTTNPGNYQDAAAGYYSGGGASVRTKNTAINPLSMSPPVS